MRLRPLFPFLVLALGGCGPLIYTVDSIGAASVVAEAEEAHADERAPYEYYAALAYLEKAREENGEGHYDAAIRYAARARTFGGQARDRARARTSGGRDE